MAGPFLLHTVRKQGVVCRNRAGRLGMSWPHLLRATRKWHEQADLTWGPQSADFWHRSLTVRILLTRIHLLDSGHPSKSLWPSLEFWSQISHSTPQCPKICCYPPRDRWRHTKLELLWGWMRQPETTHHQPEDCPGCSAWHSPAGSQGCSYMWDNP